MGVFLERVFGGDVHCSAKKGFGVPLVYDLLVFVVWIFARGE